MRIDVTVEGVDAVDARLGGISERLVGLTPAWEEVADDFLVLEDLVWRSDGSIIGESWPALSPRWAAYKASRYPGAGMLEMTGRLRKAMSRRGAAYQRRELRANDALLGTNLGIASIHQKGGTVTVRTGRSGKTHKAKIPKRQFVKVRPGDERRWAGMIETFVADGPGRGRRRPGL